jgi:hypothetical protein
MTGLARILSVSINSEADGDYVDISSAAQARLLLHGRLLQDQ